MRDAWNNVHEIKEKKAEIKNNLHSLIFKMSQIVPLNAAKL